MLLAVIVALSAAEPPLPPPPPPPPVVVEEPPPPAPTGSRQDAAPWVHVTLHAADGVQLGRIPTASSDISIARYMFLDERPMRVCTAPCSMRVGRADDDFVIMGDDMPDSESFKLAGSSKVNIEVRSGSRALKPLGVISIVFGGIGLGAGALASFVGGVNSNGSVLSAGLVSLVAGAVLLVGGIISLRFSRTVARVVDVM